MFFFDVDDIGPYRNLEAVFIEIGSDLVPFAIRSLNFKGGTSAYVQLEDVNSEEEAIALTGRSVYLPLSFLPPLTGNKFYYHEVIGFAVVDRSAGHIGELESVIDQGPQDIFVIRNTGGEVLLPVTDEVIRRVDRKKRELHVEAPEGLLDIYLNLES